MHIYIRKIIRKETINIKIIIGISNNNRFDRLKLRFLSASQNLCINIILNLIY